MQVAEGQDHLGRGGGLINDGEAAACVKLLEKRSFARTKCLEICMQQLNAFSTRAISGQDTRMGAHCNLYCGASHVTWTCPDQTLYCDFLSKVKCMTVEVVDTGIGL